MSHLIPIEKNGEVILIAPGSLEEHERLGWSVKWQPIAGDDVVGGANEPADMTADELRDALSAAGVTHDKRMGKDKLQALHAAFERSGLSAAEWNNLAGSDKAARIAVVK